jgi:hypothetical protein
MSGRLRFKVRVAAESKKIVDIPQIYARRTGHTDEPFPKVFDFLQPFRYPQVPST